MTTFPKRTKSLSRLRMEMAADYRQLAGYRALLALAETLPGMEDQVERLAASVAEFEGEVEDRIMEAASMGYGPEDFEEQN